jgi:hypothetical protein
MQGPLVHQRLVTLLFSGIQGQIAGYAVEPGAKAPTLRIELTDVCECSDEGLLLYIFHLRRIDQVSNDPEQAAFVTVHKICEIIRTAGLHLTDYPGFLKPIHIVP